MPSVVRGGLQGPSTPAPTPQFPGFPQQPGPMKPTPVQTTVVNKAQTPPQMTKFMQMMNQRIAEQKAKESQADPYLQEQVQNLRTRLGQGPTEQAVNFANQQIDQQAAGAQKSLTDQMARRGISGSGVEGGARQALTEAAQREKARSATGIALGRENQRDALVLGGTGIMAAPGQYGITRENMTNALYPQYLSGANAIVSAQQGSQNVNLQNANLQLQQQQAAQNAANQQWAQWMQLMQMQQQQQQLQQAAGY